MPCVYQVLGLVFMLDCLAFGLGLGLARYVCLLGLVLGLVGSEFGSGFGHATLIPVNNIAKLQFIYQLECGPMPNLMVALPSIGGALCSTPQSLADADY